MGELWIAVDQVQDVHGNPVAPVRKGVFSGWDVAGEFIGRHVGPYPRTAFRAAQMVHDEPGGRWYTPGGAP